MLFNLRIQKEHRLLEIAGIKGNATFDDQGNLVSYDEEAADSWLFCLASGKPEPVEFGVPVED